MKRGDVVLAWYPFATGVGGKRRPCVIIQNDQDNGNLNNVVVAQVTSNLSRIGDKSHFLIDITTAEGKQSGLLHNSIVSCNNVATIEVALIDQIIGDLDFTLITKLNNCLKAALQIP